MCKSNKDNVATLDQLLQKKNVQLINKVANWQEAVRISLKPLEKGGSLRTYTNWGLILF